MYTTSKDETEEERRRRLDAVVDAYDGPDAGEEEVLRGDPEYIPPVEAPTPAAPVSPREPDYSAAEDALDAADRADRIERDREDAWAVERGDRALAESRAMAAELDARVRSRTPAPVDPANRAARAAMREAERRAAEERRAEGDRLGREATALYEEAPPGLSADLGRVYEMDPRFAPGPASGDIRALLADPVPRPDVPTAVDGGRHVAPGVKGGLGGKSMGTSPETAAPNPMHEWEGRGRPVPGSEEDYGFTLRTVPGYGTPEEESRTERLHPEGDVTGEGANYDDFDMSGSEIPPWTPGGEPSWARPVPERQPVPAEPPTDPGDRNVATGSKGGDLPKRGGDLPTTTGDAMAASVERGPLPIPEEVPSWEAGEVPTDTDPAREAAEFVRGLDLSGLEGGVSEALADASGYVAPHGEPDADEMGGPPDMDADDLGTTGAAMERSAERAAEVRPERARWEAVTDPWDESMDDSYAPSPLASTAVPQAEGEAEAITPRWYGARDAVPQSPEEMALVETPDAPPWEMGEAEPEVAVPYDRNPGTDDMDRREWGDLPNDPEVAAEGWVPPAERDAAPREVAIDWGDEYEEPLNVVGGYDETPLNAPGTEDVSTTPFDNGEPVPDYVRLSSGGVPPASHPEPDADEMGGPPDMDVDDMGRGDRPLDTEEEAFAGPPPSRDDETWGMATDEDPILPAAPIDREADAAAMAAKVPSGTTGPPADDFTGADWSDAIRGSIGGLLQALSGRGVTPLRSERDEMEERIRTRDASKRAATTAFDEAAAERGRWDADRASREAMAAERADIARTESERDYELGRRRADTGAQNADANAAATESLVATREAARARTEASGLADSEVSRTARERLRGEIELLPESIRGTAREAFTERDDWTADDVARIERDIPAFARRYLSRSGGSSGGAGGGRGEAIVSELVARGIPDSTARALSPRAQEALLRDLVDETSGHETRLDGGGRPEGGTAELVDGVWSTISYPSPSAAAASSRAYREGWGATRESFNALDRIESVINRPGLATLDRAALGEISADLMTLRSLAARTQGTGVINPTEMPAIDAAIPNPADLVGTATGSLRSRLESWRNAALRGVMLGARDLGVSDEGVARLRSGLSGRGYSGRATTDDVTGEPLAGAPMDEVSTEERYVTMRSPSGLEVEVPEDEVERFVSMGAEVVDGP